MTPEHSRQADEMAHKIADLSMGMDRTARANTISYYLALPQMLAVIEAARPVINEFSWLLEATQEFKDFQNVINTYDAAITERKK